MVIEIFEKIYQKLKSLFLNKNFIKFCLFGIINTFNTALFSYLLSLFLQENISAIFGYIISLQGAYLLTCKFIFKSKSSFKKYKRFLISYIPSFIVYVLIHAGTLAAFNLSQFWATFFAVMLSGPVTFFIIKIYAFSESSGKKKNVQEEMSEDI